MREGLRAFCCAALRVLDDLFKDLLIEHEIRDGFPMPGVLFLHVFKPLGLVDWEAAVFLTPPVVSLFRNSDWLGSLSHRPAPSLRSQS